MAERVLLYRDAADNVFKLRASEYEALANALEAEQRLYETTSTDGWPVMLNLEHFICMFIAEVQAETEAWNDATD